METKNLEKFQLTRSPKSPFAFGLRNLKTSLVFSPLTSDFLSSGKDTPWLRWQKVAVPSSSSGFCGRRARQRRLRGEADERDAPGYQTGPKGSRGRRGPGPCTSGGLRRRRATEVSSLGTDDSALM